LALALTFFASEIASLQPQPVRGLTSAPQLARIYHTIFEARFEDVPDLLAEACGPAPREVCQVLDAVSLWWQIQLDPLDKSRDTQFLSKVNASIGSTEAWTAREPQRAEAWFYRGGAYGARVQWRVLRAQRLAAARDGKRIKDALERALELDPGLHDAYFGIGLYHYYADVAPKAAKVLRWLLFLPGGDRVEGLQEMLRARDRGALLRSEADYQLHVLYLWYERKPQRAIELLDALKLRHPSNPLFPQLIAEVQDVYLHDLTASLRSWRALLEAARQRRVAEPAMTEVRARLGVALQLDRLFETDAAIEQLQAVVAARPTAPVGALAQAHLRLGLALDRMGRRREATAAYRAAIAATAADDPLEVRARAREGLRQTPDNRVATAYRLSIEGWRALDRGSMAEAARAIEQSLALNPDDAVTRYRQARLLQARQNDADALAVLDAITRARASTPPTIYAFACIDAARLHEQRGDRARAIDLYRTATGVFGADQRTKDAAQHALTRLVATKDTKD
jgi:tetratricopeptide (TPR) repeat protein